MSDLISRKKAMSHPFANGQYDHENANKHFIMGFESYKEWLSDLPSAEKTGKWIRIHWKGFRCSRCNRMNEYFTNFCPECGADMRGEQE